MADRRRERAEAAASTPASWAWKSRSSWSRSSCRCVNSVDTMARVPRRRGPCPTVKANCDISHLHLVHEPAGGAAHGCKGRIAHVHLSDCDGKVHGDLPPGRGHHADHRLPRRDPRHRFRRHRQHRARVFAGAGQDRRMGGRGVSRDGQDHAITEMPRLMVSRSINDQ